MLAAPKTSGEHTRPACGVRRLAEQSFPAGRRKLHAGTRALLNLPEAAAFPCHPLKAWLKDERRNRRERNSVKNHWAKGFL